MPTASPSLAQPRAVAVIDEQVCIGCTLCIQACPVDAIVGATKLMHTVISDECIGCELCVPPCPVDCISMIPVEPSATGWSDQSADEDTRRRTDRARKRFEARNARLERLKSESAARRNRRLPDMAEFRALAKDERQRVLAAAIARGRAKKGSPK